jgi:hypothetical protein
VEIGLSLRPFTRLTTFIHVQAASTRHQHLLDYYILCAVASSLTHLQVPTLTPNACFDLPLTLRILSVQYLPAEWPTLETERKWHAHLALMRHLTQLRLGLDIRSKPLSIVPYSLVSLARNSPDLLSLVVPVCVCPVEPLTFQVLTTLVCRFQRPVFLSSDVHYGIDAEKRAY